MSQIVNHTKDGFTKVVNFTVHKGSEFYKKILYFEFYSTNCKDKPVIAERFIRILKDKMYEYMAAVQKNMYISKLPKIVKNTTTLLMKQLKSSLLVITLIH